MNDETTLEDTNVPEETTETTAEIAALKAAAETLDLRTSLEAAHALNRDAVMRYREARLAATPEIPPELVPDSEDISEIDRGMDAAQRLVSHIRERAKEDAVAASTVIRVPAGSPPRRAPDLASLSASEKIRMGLERLADNDGR